MEYKLMNDYDVDWPVWADEGAAAALELELPRRLTTEVRAWAKRFNDLYSYETGWPDARTGRENEAEGKRLVEAIRRELNSGDSIVLRYWETLNAGGSYWETQRRR